MKTKLLLDTNLLIYGLDGGSIFHQKTVAVLTNPNLELYTTTKNISKYFAVAFRTRCMLTALKFVQQEFIL